MKALTSTLGQLHVFRLEPGTDLLEGLQAAVSEAGIHQGVILAGIGALTSYHFHVVDEPQWPPANLFARGEGGFDIVSLQGYVIDGRAHVHIALCDVQKVMGGHLERGCEVFTFALVTVAELEGAELRGLDRSRRQ